MSHIFHFKGILERGVCTRTHPFVVANPFLYFALNFCVEKSNTVFKVNMSEIWLVRCGNYLDVILSVVHWMATKLLYLFSHQSPLLLNSRIATVSPLYLEMF